MSDYLWDKSGETDPEVEQLEEMLKGLRYQPRELQLPETEAPVVQSSRRRYWPGLAVAASLLLMGLAGLWLGQHRRQEVSPKPAVVAAVLPTPEMQVRAVEGAPVPEPEKPVSVKDDRRQAQDSFDAPPRRARTAKRVGPQRAEQEARPASSPEQEMASLGRERQLDQQAEGVRAKEELMLALQVASAKLNHAQRKARAPIAEPSQDVKPTTAPASSNPWNKSR